MTVELRTRTLRLVAPAEVEGEITDRRERRYLMTSDQADAVAQALADHKDANHPEYSVTTTYLSSGGAAYRLRQYDDGSELQLESKLRDDQGRVVKTRFKLSADPPKAQYQGTVWYRRAGFQVGDVRVTIDRDVRTTSRRLGVVVVEVKGSTIPREIAGLLPDENLTFGKRSWAVDANPSTI